MATRHNDMTGQRKDMTGIIESCVCTATTKETHHYCSFREYMLLEDSLKFSRTVILWLLGHRI